MPPLLTEMEATDHLAAFAARNAAAAAEDVYLGAGSYRHFIPAAVGQILARGEFYTAYTPYQPEVAQGTLQVIYEFQSLVAALTGMDVANASMYDGATALAEGALMTVSMPRGGAGSSFRRPFTQHTATFCAPISRARPRARRGAPGNSRVLTAPMILLHIWETIWPASSFSTRTSLAASKTIAAMAELAHARGGALVVSTYPVPLGLLQPPGELGGRRRRRGGAGARRSTGVRRSVRRAPRLTQSYVRQMPGRLAGMTTDTEGKRGFVLTLQTREQHIRREKATSNICTNQGLMATAATVYMATLGPEGFREVARRSYQNAHYLADRVSDSTRLYAGHGGPVLPRVRRFDACSRARGSRIYWSTGSTADSTSPQSIRISIAPC